LIGGPNETGKSTLVEALHRVLFLKAAGGSQLRQAMVSTLHGGHPEVVLHFEVGGVRHELHKKFSGANGTAILSREGLPPLSGSAAESELARILGVGTEVSRGEIPLQWAHLWVWQGKSGEDPTTYANDHQAALQQRLQAIGGDTLLTSPMDVRLAAHFAGEVDAQFKTGDQPKAGTPLALANDEVAAATTARNAAQARLDRLHFAVSEVEATTAELASYERAVQALKTDTAALAGKLSQLKNLQSQEAVQASAQQTAQKAHADLDLAHQNILRLNQRHQREAMLVEPLANEEKLLSAKMTSAIIIFDKITKIRKQ
jgi:DNA repair exonuclease SbcCD ATPase subunit